MTSRWKISNKRDVAMCLVIIAGSLAGIGHTFLGKWSKGAGESAKLFPRFVYGLLIAVSLALLIREFCGKAPVEPPAIPQVRWYQPIVFCGCGAVFFLAVCYVGPAVSICVYLVGMISAFAMAPKKEIKATLIVSLVSTLVLWAVFTYVIPLTTMTRLLF